MLGPRIIAQPEDDAPVKRAATEDATGIRRSPSSSRSWDVIVRGRYIETFTGLGAQAKAARSAGTHRILP
jgi:hypothetical protein